MKQNPISGTMHDIVVSSVLPTCYQQRCASSSSQGRDVLLVLACVSLVPSQNAVICDLGTRLLSACTHILKMAFYATGSSCSVVEKLGFDSVEVMKTLSVRGNSPRDKRQFRAKTTVSTRTNLEL